MYFLATDTILSFEQLWRRHPEVSVLYPDERLTICEHVEISSCQVTRLFHPPQHLLKLDLARSSLMHFNRQVHK